MECQVSMLAHYCDWSIYKKDDDDDSNDDGYNKNTWEAADDDADTAYEDEREKEKCEQEHKEDIRKRF